MLPWRPSLPQCLRQVDSAVLANLKAEGVDLTSGSISVPGLAAMNPVLAGGVLAVECIAQVLVSAHAAHVAHVAHVAPLLMITSWRGNSSTQIPRITSTQIPHVS